VTISFIDLQHKIIPDVLSLPGIILGWGASLILLHISWLDSLIGLIAGGGVLFLVAFVYEHITGREGMGGGDIKLLAMIGAWMGWKPLPFVLLVSSFTGAVFGLVFLLAAGKGYRVRIPFGPFLSMGAIAVFFFGPELAGWYAALFR
jgi:leader peptidase (prepilin peptidase)/N-methyltransferase